MKTADVTFWPFAAESHAVRDVGNEGQSGPGVLNVSFVEADPKRPVND